MKASTRGTVKSVLLGLCCLYVAAMLLLPTAASRVLTLYAFWGVGLCAALCGLLLIVAPFLPRRAVKRRRRDEPMKVREP